MKYKNMEISEKNVSGFEECAGCESTTLSEKKDYASPRLISLGAMSAVTLAGSPGGTDSGGSLNEKFPG